MPLKLGGKVKLMKNTKIAAMLLGLTLGTAGIASAATADSFTDVPKDHWSYEALDYLAQNGVIEGYADGTFAGNRTMSRYEMASIVAKAMQADAKGIGSQAVLEKLEAEYGGELRTLKSQVEENTKAIAENKKAIERVNIHGFLRAQYDYDKNKDAKTLDHGNNRFYMDLRGDFKVNDIWTVKFQNEMNRRYNDGHHRGETGFSSSTGEKTWSGHDGNFQRIWVEGYQDGKWINIGRSWRGLGFQNVLFGNESDGFQFGVPIPGTHLTGSGFWMASTGSGNKESLYGVGTWGSIGHAVDINLAYAKSSLDKGETYSSGNVIGFAPSISSSGLVTLNPVLGVNDQVNGRSYGFVASAGINLAKNVRLITDYVKTDADFQNNSLALRLNYKGTDLNKKGSWGAYARYIRYGANGWLAGDDEWGSTPNGTKGWIVGLKYVPWKNVEWETLYSNQTRGYDQNWEYDRQLFRTQVDFHF